MKSMRRSSTAFIVLAALTLVSATAHAALVSIGPGAGLAGTTVSDTANQERLNIALSSPSGGDFVNLLAGTYSVRDFQLNVFNHNTGTGGAGIIVPMLVTGSSGSWTALWIGEDFDPTSNGVQTAASYAPGAETFDLAVDTDVYAGIFTRNNGSNIPAINLSVGRTDHDGTPSPPTNPGDIINGISNPNLGRAYAFEINVEPLVSAPVPEPATSVLLGLGGLALVFRRRK